MSRNLDERGAYFLTIPDMRYTFDCFRSETKIEEILAAHQEARTLHARQTVIDFYVHSTHNDPTAHWRSEHGPHPGPDIRERQGLAERQLATGDCGYVDIHNWFFTPQGFRRVISEAMVRSGTNLEVERVYSIPFGRNEFDAVLRKI